MFESEQPISNSEGSQSEKTNSYENEQSPSPGFADLARQFEDAQHVNEEAIQGIVESASDEDFFQLLRFIGDSQKDFALSHNTVKQILSRGYHFLGSEPSFVEEVELVEALKKIGPEKLIRAYRDLYYDYPQQSNQFWETLWQELETVSPQHFLPGLADLYADPAVDDNLKSSIAHFLNYLNAYSDEDEVTSALKQSLNFEEQQYFDRTAASLELVRATYQVGDQYWSENAREELRVLLKDVVDEQKGSYFLNKRAEQIYRNLSEEGFENSHEHLPFQVASDRWGLHTKFRLLISQPEDQSTVEPIVEEVNEVLRSQRVGEDFTKQKYDELYEQLEEYLHPISQDEVMLSNSVHVDDEGALRDYQQLTRAPFREQIEEDFNISLPELSLYEQFQLLNFVKKKNASEVSYIQEFSDRYGIEGFRTFLALEHDKDIGDDIVFLGNYLNKEGAEQIFSKYSELSDIAQNTVEYLRDHFGEDKEYSEEAINQIRENLLRQGKDLLARFAREARDAQERGEDLDTEEVAQKLAQTKTETQAFLSSFKTLKRQGHELSFQEIKDTDLSSVSPEELSEEDVQQMRNIYEENYANYPEAFRDKLLSSFKRSLNEESVTLYTFRHEGQVRGFYRLSPVKEGRFHVGAFNLDPQYQGAALGETIMQESLDQVAQNAVLEAECSQTAPVSASYIERGFIATDAFSAEGVPSLKIIRNEQANDMFPTKAWSIDRIKERARPGERVELQDGTIIVAAEQDERAEDLPFDILTQDNVVLTRLLRSERHTGDRYAYAVFERKDLQEITSYVSPPGQEPA